jgi:ABC-type phosphonate transport system ATPase subunit
MAATGAAVHGSNASGGPSKEECSEGSRRPVSSGQNLFENFLVAGDKKVTRIRHAVACETI